MPPSPDAEPLHPAQLELEKLGAECDFRATRRSGPGGQNRNKVETAVILTHRPSGLSAEASEWRTQGENRRAALFRLRVNLALKVRTEPCAAASGSKPASARWHARCREGRIVINPEHDDFPALLAEALDRLAEAGFEPKAASAGLGCSPSQLIRLLRLEPRALALVNAQREQRELHPLQ